MSTLGTLLIRTDVTTQIGIGHIMRCLALAEAWQSRKGKVVMACHCQSDSFRNRLENSGVTFLPISRPYPHRNDLDDTLAAAKNVNPDWIVLDGYHFDSFYQQRIHKQNGTRVMVIDDNAHLHFYHGDMLLNQNINAHPSWYESMGISVLLLGLQYLLLRREFESSRHHGRIIPPIAEKVLVTLGGSDPDNMTLKIIEALQQLEEKNMAVKIVVGPFNPHLDSLRETISKKPNIYELVLNPAHMAGIMMWADMAISAAGSTCWELACMGVPSILVVLSENQEGLASGLQEIGAARSVGWCDQLTPSDFAKAVHKVFHDPSLRRQLSELSRKAVDGSGTDRVIDAMESYKCQTAMNSSKSRH